MSFMETNIGKKFIEWTKYSSLGPSEQMKGIRQPPLEKDYDKSKNKIQLRSPDEFKFNNVNLTEAIKNRKSIRSYSRQFVSIDELSYMLWCTQGVKRVIPGHAIFRTVPSAGARHAFETYLFLKNVEGIPPCLYRFLTIEHRLLEINQSQELSDKIKHACLGQDMIKESAVIFIWVAVVNRMTWRYGERGYRYLYLDAGHVCQNLYLCVEAIKCGACAIGAFDDDEMNQIIGLNGKDEFVIYLATVGKRNG